MTKLPVKNNFKDPFNAGQMIGMLMVLALVEKEQGIENELLQRLKWTAAKNAGIFMDLPAEDVHLHINKIFKKELNL